MNDHRLEQVFRLLPERLRKETGPCGQECVEELRLRLGRPLSAVTGQGEKNLSISLVEAEDLQNILNLATEFSAYHCAESIRNGYITLKGGCRIGLCGSAVLREGEIATLQDISSLAIRIARECSGIAAELYSQLWEGDTFQSALLIAPPGGGKTTMLRDLIRCLSEGDKAHRALRCGVVDERCEIAASVRGVPQFDLGCHTDVLSMTSKEAGILMLLRSMNPEVIAVDEITAPEDIHAMEMASNCGVSFVATVHGRDLQEIRTRRLTRELLQKEVFHRAVILEKQGVRRRFRVEAC